MQKYQLSALQMSVMKVLWRRSEATAAQVHSDLVKDRNLAFTTVSTVLARLEKRGLITHNQNGRQYVFRPLITEKQARSSMLHDLIDRVFAGDPSELVSHLIRESEISDSDLDRVKTLIEKAQNEEERDVK